MLEHAEGIGWRDRVCSNRRLHTAKC